MFGFKVAFFFLLSLFVVIQAAPGAPPPHPPSHHRHCKYVCPRYDHGYKPLAYSSSGWGGKLVCYYGYHGSCTYSKYDGYLIRDRDYWKCPHKAIRPYHCHHYNDDNYKGEGDEGKEDAGEDKVEKGGD